MSCYYLSLSNSLTHLHLTISQVRERLASYKDDKQVDLTKEEKAAQHGQGGTLP